MVPVLLHLGPIKIYTFGVFLMLAFFWGSFLLWKNIRLTSFKEEEIFDGLFIALASGLFFSRLVYFLLNFSDFGFDLLKFILINGYPGLNFYGFLLGSFIALHIFFRYKKIKFSQVIDYFIGPIFIALGFGSLGGFFSELPLQMSFFYQAVIFFIGVVLAQKLLFDIRRGKYSLGFLFFFFLWFIGATYFVFDKLKSNHLYWKGLSFNSLVSLIILLLTSAYFIYYFREKIIAYGYKTYQKIYQRTESFFRNRAKKG